MNVNSGKYGMAFAKECKSREASRVCLKNVYVYVCSSIIIVYIGANTKYKYTKI